MMNKAELASTLFFNFPDLQEVIKYGITEISFEHRPRVAQFFALFRAEIQSPPDTIGISVLENSAICETFVFASITLALIELAKGKEVEVAKRNDLIKSSWLNSEQRIVSALYYAANKQPGELAYSPEDLLMHFASGEANVLRQHTLSVLDKMAETEKA